MMNFKNFGPVAAVILALLSACGGPANGPEVAAETLSNLIVSPGLSPAAAACTADCGTVLVGMTDADGDFLTYTVTVESLQLTRNDGVVVDVLPLSTAVDFAQYTELTEFLSATTVPPGVYVAAQITLDYANADIAVERDGVAVETQAFDAQGLPLGVETLEIILATTNRLVVAPGIPSLLIIDFDLAASHDLDLSVTPAVAVAEPFLLAEVDPVATGQMRVRGPLVTSQPDQNVYTVALRPFWQWGGDFGRLRVHTSDQTTFEVDGVGYTGNSGLQALAALPATTATLALGSFDVAERRYSAKEVYAGSSVPGYDADALSGVVTARAGDTLTVRGATLVRARGAVIYVRAIDVLIGPDTRIAKAGEPGFVDDIMAVSVGQKVTVSGTVATSGTGERVFDASGGRLRLLRTVVTGVTNHIEDGAINVAAQQIAGRNVGIFDFTGTGAAGNDADADHYEIDTGVLDLDLLETLAPVKVSGFATAFGLAPPDFTANTVADYSDSPGTLSIGWVPSSASAFLTLGPEGLALDLTNPDIARRHHIRTAGINTDLLSFTSATVVAQADAHGLYAVRADHSIRIYTDFAEFSTDLANSLASGASTRSLTAHGQWSLSALQLQSSRIVVRID